MSSPKKYLWQPDDHAWTRESHLAKFMRAQHCATPAELHAWSVRDTAKFWDAAVKDCGIEWAKPYTQVKDDSRGFAWTKWFVGGEANITHNCIDRHVRDGHGDEIALYYEADSDAPESRGKFTFAQLKKTIDACCRKLTELGVGRGDSVGLYAPMCVQTVEIMLATFKIGARFVPIFCGYGEAAVVERLASCEAKFLFAVEHLHRRGKTVMTGDIARAAAAQVPSINHVLMFDTPAWPDFVYSGGYGTPYAGVQTAAEEAAMIIYTSGTTGRPKGTVHTHAGCLAQPGKELRYAFNVQPGEPFFWFTDIGWMMGPWEIIGCLFYRTPIVLFDGAPDFPDSDRLWRTLARLQVVTFCASPTLVRMFMRVTAGRGPQGHDLSSLRMLGSTGEPWDETSYRWFFEHVGGGRCPIINISGGTELLGCLLSCTPLTPLRPCSLGAPALGMDVVTMNDEGELAAQGAVGHLVCRQPAPSMTKSFLHDDARYLETYFSRWPAVWYHGDWAREDADGSWFVLGRSDDTIKVAGKRVGPAEVEGVLTSHPAVSEAATIGAPDDLKGQVLVCFVVLKPGASVETAELVAHVTKQMGKPLAPKAVHVVAALPKTRSGKILRGMILRVYSGQPAGDLTSVDNPAALEEIRTAIK
ncbi:MAG: AMP-binding protein [Cephaloticoccus sp.]|nr:AMP-binding protein [Cephaloticoccus sp.]MCF7760080.1 AMP-binding protein [Cephaloticoccus sp.]